MGKRPRQKSAGHPFVSKKRLASRWWTMEATYPQKHCWRGRPQIPLAGHHRDSTETEPRTTSDSRGDLWRQSRFRLVIERITVEVYTQALSQDDNRMVVQGSMAQRRTQPLRSA